MSGDARLAAIGSDPVDPLGTLAAVALTTTAGTLTFDPARFPTANSAIGIGEMSVPSSVKLVVTGRGGCPELPLASGCSRNARKLSAVSTG